MTKKIKIYQKDGKVVSVDGLPKGYTWMSRKKKVIPKVKHYYRFCSERLKFERLKRGLSYREVASLIENFSEGTYASQSLIYNWEVKGQSPSGLHMFVLCEIFKKDLSYFIVKIDEKYDFEKEFQEIYDAIPERGPRERFRAEYFAKKADKLIKEIKRARL